jgi:KIX domain
MRQMNIQVTAEVSFFVLATGIFTRNDLVRSSIILFEGKACRLVDLINLLVCSNRSRVRSIAMITRLRGRYFNLCRGFYLPFLLPNPSKRRSKKMENTPEKDADDKTSEWRSSVQQSYRNQQVRGIAKELAGLEPGATEASKLRLAMQFEDSVYKSGTSLADYHKKLTKRLNKLKKTYKPPTVVTGGGGGDGSVVVDQKEKEQKIKDLIGKHGETLRYICTHAVDAVQEMRHKQGDEKAKQLQQHVEAAKSWAKMLGIVSNNNNGAGVAGAAAYKPNFNMSQGELERLTHNIEKRLDTIRSHTVKLIEPDAFLVENIKKIEEEFRDKPGAVKLQSEVMRLKVEKIRAAVGIRDFESVAKSLETATKLVPLSLPPKEAALRHLSKMNAASHVLLGYLLADDKYSVPKQALLRAHDVAGNTSLKAVQDYMKELRAEEKSNAGLQLRDVWMKRLVLPPTDNGVKLAIRSKVLLKPGRHAPCAPKGAGAHVIVPFGGVFTMTIYFVPLVVTLRAGNKPIGDVSQTCAAWTPLDQGGVDDWLVQERLRDASSEATQVLRKCFANKASKATAEFEIEVLETSALLEFIELAKQTFLA